MPVDPTLGFVLVAAYGLLLVPAAWHKWRDIAVFEAVLSAYRLLPRELLPVVARVIPCVEAATALALWFTSTRPLAAIVVAVLMLVYAGAIAVNLQRGRTDLDCGCTGPLERRPVAAWMVYRNALLAGLVAPLAGVWDVRPLQGLDFFSIVVALSTIVLLWLAIDRLLGQVAPRGAALKASR
jgi:Methylamine utilisation protein MauE